MAVIKKTLFPKNLDKYAILVDDTQSDSKYFKITELPDTFTGGKNAFLIAGSEYLVPDTKIQIELKDSAGNIVYHEPGEGLISSSVNGESFISEYYEGVSKVVAVYVYPDTAYGPCTLTILGELSEYQDSNGLTLPVPLDWENKYNVRWQKQIDINPSLANTTKIRFYQRPQAAITELLSPLYRIENDLKVASNVTQSFADIKLSRLETFAGDVKRVKVFRTSEGDISDYDLIQDILVESKELLTTFGLSGSVVGETGILTSETLKNYWKTGSLNAFLTSSRVESGVRLTGSGNFTYSSSLDIRSTNTYELNLDAFYSSSTSSNLGIYLSYVSQSTTFTSSIATLVGTQPTKNLLDTVIPFRIDRDYPSASLYFSQSQGEWHLGNISLRLSEDTAFSPDEVSFVTTMPSVLGNEIFNFKFEFYDVNNNYVPVEVTQSALFTGGNNNINGTLTLISSSTSASLDVITKVSSSISGTMTVYSSSASSSISSLSASVSSSNSLILSSSLSKVQQLANGQYSGSFIGDTVIYSPTIGGQQGYISDLFKVGTTPSIYLDARQNPRKIFIGGVSDSGSYNNSNTTVYMDSTGKFSLGNKLTWSGDTLTVTGNINISGGDAATKISNAALSGSNAQTTANSATSAASSAATAASNAQTAADTAASKIFTDAAGKIIKAAAPTGKGLFLDSTNLGFYNTTDYPSSPWRTYMDSSGNFQLVGAGSNGLTWNAGTSALSIDGNITARNGTFVGNITSTATISGGTLSGGTISGGSITIGSNFSVDTNGNMSANNASIAGAINAGNGSVIGGWNISNSQIYVPNSIVLDATAKQISISDSGGTPRVILSQDASLSNLTTGGSGGGAQAQTSTTTYNGTASTSGTAGTIATTSGLSYVISVSVPSQTPSSIAFSVGGFGVNLSYNTYCQIRKSNGTVLGTLFNWSASGTGVTTLYWTDGTGGTPNIVGQGGSLALTGDGDTWSIYYFAIGLGGASGVVAQVVTPNFNWSYVVSVGKTEIVPGGFQVVYDTNRYLRVPRTASGTFVQVGGDITATGTITPGVSDGRLKENIINIDNPLVKINNINGVYFNFTDDATYLNPSLNKNKQVGVIAQEIKSIFEEVPDLTPLAPFDNDGEGNSKSGENYMTVQYEKIIPLLIEGIKELSNKVNMLEEIISGSN
jgi:hypothetical protein